MNVEIKSYIKRSRFYQWEIAKQIGVSEATLIRWLRSELTDAQKSSILSAIHQMKEAETCKTE